MLPELSTSFLIQPDIYAQAKQTVTTILTLFPDPTLSTLLIPEACRMHIKDQPAFSKDYSKVLCSLMVDHQSNESKGLKYNLLWRELKSPLPCACDRILITSFSFQVYCLFTGT